ncbi:hypothetical protein JCM10212_001626 [Sporobolomyces blumeae]
MGSGASRPEQEIQPGGADQTFFANRDSPVQFGESLINHLSSSSKSNETNDPQSTAVPPSRQQALDSLIQQRIHSELEQLRKQEQQVREEIERALEKENLDRERGQRANDDGQGKSAAAALSHSASLLEDLKRLEERSKGLKKERNETPEWKQVEIEKQHLVQCFSENSKTPLECRSQAEKFKEAVAGLEKAFVASVN